MENENENRLYNAVKKFTPYIAMVSLQFGYAGMNIITKVSLNRGMSHYVLVVYRHAVATAVMAPFAYFLERKIRPRLTVWTFCQICLLGLLGPVVDQNFYYAGLKLTSATFAGAIDNVLPAMTFVMAALCRMERVNLRERRCQAKIGGTIVGAGGAMIMTLYKGPILGIHPHSHSHSHSDAHYKQVSSTAMVSDKEQIMGSLFLVASTLAWATFFVLQAAVLNKYSAPLSLTTLICLLGTLQATAVTLAIEHNPSEWAIGWDMNLLTAVYSGVVASGIAYYVQGVCMKLKGPVFATAFSPLTMIILAFMGSTILSETIYLGMVVGGVVIVIGLYAVLWGKLHDQAKNNNNNIKQDLLPQSQVKDARPVSFTEMSIVKNDAIQTPKKSNPDRLQHPNKVECDLQEPNGLP